MKALHDQICCRAEAAQAEVIDVCSRLIQFPPVNPPGSTRDIVTYTASYFAAHDMSAQVILCSS
jgi:hypothetical protein